VTSWPAEAAAASTLVRSVAAGKYSTSASSVPTFTLARSTPGVARNVSSIDAVCDSLERECPRAAMQSNVFLAHQERKLPLALGASARLLLLHGCSRHRDTK
jgi:hypothetical protein